MADAHRRTRNTLLWTLALVTLNLAAFNVLISGWSTARLDLTEDGLFSISPATRRLLTSLEDEVTVYGYFSKKTHPKLAPLVPEIRDLLKEYEAVSGGKVHVEFLDPGEDEEVEREANDRYGVQSTPFRLASKYEAGIVNAYFNLVIKYGDQYVKYGFEDLIQVEPLPDGDIDVRLRNLEYDLTRAIKKVVYGFRSATELFDRIAEPVRFTVIWTPDSLPEVFRDVPEAVRKAVDELKDKGGEKFIFEEIDPSGDEAKQQEVFDRYGARPMSAGLLDNRTFYLYGILEIGDRREQILLVRDGLTAADVREAIENSLRRHVPGFLKTVGIVSPESSLPPEVLMQLRMQGRMPPQPPDDFQEVRRFLEQDYNVRKVDLKSPGGVPTEVDVLLVLAPENLDERAVFNLDQYLMRGGRVILCVNNFKVDFGAGGLHLSPVETGLDDWLKHFGVEVPKTLVLDDRNQPLPVPEVRYTALGAVRTWTLAPYPYLVDVREDGLVDPNVTAGLDGVGIYWGSPVVVHEDQVPEGVQVLELLRSSGRSWTNDDPALVNFVDYTVPEEGTQRHLLAAALSGSFPSYFAEHDPPGAEGSEDDAGDEGEAPSPPPVPLKVSPETRLVVIGNASFLSDLVAQVLGQFDGGFFTANLRFAENLIDWVSLDNDLISIRAQGARLRRLTRISKATEVTLEAVNYLIPLSLLLGLAAYRYWRRRHAEPLVQIGTASHAAPEVTRGRSRA